MSELGQYNQFHDHAASSIFTSLTFLAALQESKIFKAGPLCRVILYLAASLFRATITPFQHFERFETDSLTTHVKSSNFHLKTPFNDLYDLIINPVTNLLADQ
jgi:hypothetical protein